MSNFLAELIPLKFDSVIPINITVASNNANPTVSVSASTANTAAIPSWTNKIEIIPDVVPVTPIYIRWSFGLATGLDASATAYDQKLSECKSLAEFAVAHNLSHVSFFSTTACTLSVIYT